MIAGQRLIASDGYEVALFPMPYLYMSQDEGGDFSHLGTYNIDLIGYSPNTSAPIYAPCTMKVVQYASGYAAGNRVTWESVDKVHLPNGALDYLTIGFAHDPNPPYTTIGQTVTQGDLCYHTGAYGQVTGDHTHTCAGQGHYVGYTLRETGHYDLTNRIHYWDAVFVNDTTIIQGYGHNWQIWNGPPGPTPGNKTEWKQSFPWAVARRRWPGFKRR